MGKRLLLIAEKPSMMRDIQQYYRNHPSEFQDNIVFTAFHGHLMELADPKIYDPKFAKWNESDLPILPSQFIYQEKDPESCKKIMGMINSGHYDGLINACDADREGEHIFFSFYEAHKLTLPVLRFWASDLTDASIKMALQGLMPASNFDGMRAASKFRAQLDWLAGINFSRAGSLRTEKKLNIGRVISPTLKIVVDREREILKFVVKDFYELQGKFKVAAGEYIGTCLVPPDNKQTRFAKKEDAEALQKKLGTKGTVVAVDSKRVTTKAPTLYSMTELQKDGAKYFGYSAEKTMELAQSLYEKHFTSYPRSDVRFLPTAMVPEIKKHLLPIEETPLKAYAQAVTQADIDKVCKGKDYICNVKGASHHAIIPTIEKPNFASLTQDEQNMYLMICKRFLSIFMKPYVVEKTTLVTEVNGALFKTNGKVEVDKGFVVLYESKAKDTILPAVKKGDTVELGASQITNGQTTPPSRYNTASLLEAMQNAGSFVSSAESRKILKEAAGLGTSATRANILKKLETTKMCEVKKGVFYPTAFGMALIDIIGDRTIASPEMTAEWEKKLMAIEDNSYQGDFKSEMENFIKTETMDMLTNIKKNLSAYELTTVGICPCCKQPVVDGKEYFRCANYKKSCSFIVKKEKMGAKITVKDLGLLLKGKPTPEKTLKTNDGKEIKTVLILDSEHRLVPVYAVNGSKKDESLDVSKIKESDFLGKCPCPGCSGHIYEARNFFLCTSRQVENCSWTVKKELCEATVTAKDIKGLLNGKPTEKKKFKWKSGKTGEARLNLEGQELKFLFN